MARRAARRRGGGTETRRFALLGVFAAMMVLVMMLEIPPFSIHFNLSVMTAIVLGPELAVPAALIVNVILALLGHGGLTVVGLNTLVLSTEMLAGYGVFRLLVRRGRKPALPAFAATLIGLAAGALVSFGFVALGRPGIDAMLQSASLAGRHEVELPVTASRLDLARLALLMFGVGAIGWVLEAILCSALVVHLRRALPGLSGEQDP